MLRRPLTAIELKFDDMVEYEEMRREAAKEQAKAGKPSNDLPTWQAGPKSKEEVYQRIGYIPPERPRVPSRSFTNC